MMCNYVLERRCLTSEASRRVTLPAPVGQFERISAPYEVRVRVRQGAGVMVDDVAGRRVSITQPYF